MKPQVFMRPINPTLCRRTLRLIRKRIINDKSSYFDNGQHILPINSRTSIFHFEDYFERQSPKIFSNENQFHALVGFTHTGFAVKLNKKANIFPPNHFCSVILPGEPEIEYQYIGTGPHEAMGTSLISYKLENHMRIQHSIFNMPDQTFKKW